MTPEEVSNGFEPLKAQLHLEGLRILAFGSDEGMKSKRHAGWLNGRLTNQGKGER